MTGSHTSIRAMVFGLALLVLVCAGVQAQDPQRSTLPLKAEMTGGFTGTIGGLYLAADPSVVWKPGRFAAGVGTELLFGVSQFDISILPYARLELGNFHLDVGYALPVLPPLSGDGVKGPEAGLAWAPKPFDMGYGRMGMDLGLNVTIPVFVSAYDQYAGAGPLERVAVATILSGRFGLGITYAFSLL